MGAKTWIVYVLEPWRGLKKGLHRIPTYNVRQARTNGLKYRRPTDKELAKFEADEKAPDSAPPATAAKKTSTAKKKA